MTAEFTLWAKRFKGQPEAAIEWAFETYLGAGSFFPKPADIGALIVQWRTNQRLAIEEAKVQNDHETDRIRREAGETVGTGDVLKQFDEIVRTKAMPFPDPTYRTQLKQKQAEIIERRAERVNQRQVEG